MVIEPDRSELIVHHDAAPWNLIVSRDRWVFIDWDNAGPGSRLWDLAYAAHGFVPLSPETPAAEAGARLAALADGRRLQREGHGDTWRRDADYVERYATLLTNAMVHASQ